MIRTKQGRSGWNLTRHACGRSQYQPATSAGSVSLCPAFSTASARLNCAAATNKVVRLNVISAVVGPIESAS
jgi:hypothetical protein